MKQPFVFAACNPGSEGSLKNELARTRPELRLAFSGPGFVTFKTPAPVDASFEMESAFARVYGVSIGALGVQEIAELARSERTPRVAVFPRGDDREAVARTREELLASGAFAPGAPAIGDTVVDVAVDPAAKAPLWVGAHVHTAERSVHEGGLLPVELHPQAPSRAYLKIEEAITRFDLPVRRGQRALELGSSPGGASFALVERGLHVLGVDPGEMDPRVLASPLFEHRKIPAGALKKQELPKRVDWVLADMNLAPPITLRYLARVVGPLKKSLRGAVVTLKMNDPTFEASIPDYVKLVLSMGFRTARAIQLPSHGREIAVVARNP